MEKKQRNNNETANSTERNVLCSTENCVNLNSAYYFTQRPYNIYYTIFEFQ